MLHEQCEAQLATRYNLLMPQGSASTALGVAATIGMVLLGILSASALGAEYSLGTLRPILLRGVGRQTLLGGKLLVLAVSTTGALFLATAAAAASGVLISAMAEPPTVATAITSSWGEVAISFVRVWATLLAFLTLASVLTLLTRSTAAGMALSLGLYLFEGLFVRLMTLAFSWFEQVGDYLPMRNINALARSTYNLAPGGTGGSAVSIAHASIVVAVYVLVAAVIAVVVFRRRDVVGSSGS
jgi:ABC-2 type transport system permease protein